MDALLVATDLSPRADRAVRRAARLAQSNDAALHAVYVLDHGLPQQMVETVEAEAHATLGRLCREAGAKAVLHVVQGDPATDVHAVAREIDAGLIVLGTHRPRPVIDVFRETTLERLVRLSHRPVLMVRDLPDRDYDRVLAALDFSPASTGAVRLARMLFPDAETTGFHAVHVPFQGLTDAAGHAADARHYLNAAKSDLVDWAEAQGLTDLAVEIAEGALHPVLQHRIAANKPDLLALGAHGRTGKAPFLLGSFANDMMRDPPCDLLIARH